MRRLLVDANARSRTWALTPEAERRLRDAAPPDWEVRVVQTPTSSDGDGPPQPSAEVVTGIAEAEVYLGFGMPRPLFLAARRLRWAHSAAAGVGSALFPEMLASDVVLTNSAGVHAIPIAEYIVAAVMYFLRGFDIAVAQQRELLWSKQAFVDEGSPLGEISGRRVLVIGAGGIGSEAAERLTALGARCVGVRRHPGRGAPRGFQRVVGMDAVDAELPSVDVLVLAAPLTAETRGLVTAERLDLLPSHAILINVGRGALVDEQALIQRLASARLRGAALDVFETEPLASDSPLWQLRNVLITPHVSPVSPGRFWPRELDVFLDNWDRYVRGAPLRNVVNKAAGY
ncbi:MAG TPA: D-2-hydroxyacid dehydrogenase [Gemmatimonadaceae bacterium]|nr:D-2-hydroxyacid dehydrogenase [Gemmatimonadaceae bacterium]